MVYITGDSLFSNSLYETSLNDIEGLPVKASELEDGDLLRPVAKLRTVSSLITYLSLCSSFKTKHMDQMVLIHILLSLP